MVRERAKRRRVGLRTGLGDVKWKDMFRHYRTRWAILEKTSRDCGIMWIHFGRSILHAYSFTLAVRLG